MTLKVGINGFGRIGRNVLRALYETGRTDIKIVGINDLTDIDMTRHLLQYDSVHGRFAHEVKVDGDNIVVNGDKIKVTAERDPANLPWADLGVDMVFECTGIFRSKEKASAHIKTGAKKVIISAPGEEVDRTVVYGVNHEELTADDTVISNASCTTNCLAPVAKALNDTIGIERGLMTTIHSYTNDQNLLDLAHKDAHRARAAAISMIPSTTGAAKAVGLVLPELKGKLDGFSMRVPTPNVSVVDLTFTPKKETTIDEVNSIIKKAVADMKGALAYSDEPLVSVDFNHNPHSSIFDATQTRVMEDGKMVKVLSWYDNEWGFSNRMLDTAAYFGKL
ncbi:MAG: type I glyceraldehyde-3-phosphate dehydrogenase [Magnetococcales bacterium]|nr:type I glyceraldehyde-3-phosphate dehydrogenase [Magnetococcales bacterium]|tara:strand:+ start:475148 stop:476152 length:1005 start_codon:yes stop_codon:yes gene_type:complete